MAFAFYKGKLAKRLYTTVGIVLAILLHTSFNFFIINSNGTNMLLVFGCVWAGIIVLMLLIERIKVFTNRCLSLFRKNK